MSECIFCKIASKEINTKLIKDTEDYVSFNDLNPQAPVHALVIPKRHFSSLNELNDPEILSKLLEGARETAKKLGIQEGYRVVINTGVQAGQTVFHIHLHVLGGRDMLWPPG